MRLATNFLAIVTAATLAAANLDPATSNTKGKYPKSPGCSASEVMTSVQAAECSHNTLTGSSQSFAIFETDHQYDAVEGAPYGTCSSYSCTAPTNASMTANADYWTFFWKTGQGESEGFGTSCIKDPQTGECGCETGDGVFHVGSDSCPVG